MFNLLIGNGSYPFYLKELGGVVKWAVLLPIGDNSLRPYLTNSGQCLQYARASPAAAPWLSRTSTVLSLLYNLLWFIGLSYHLNPPF